MNRQTFQIVRTTVVLVHALFALTASPADAQSLEACTGLYVGTSIRVDDNAVQPQEREAAILADGRGCGTRFSGGVGFEIFEDGGISVLSDFVGTPQIDVRSIGSTFGCDSAVPSKVVAISFDIETCTLRYVIDNGPDVSDMAYILAPVGRIPSPPPCPDQPAGICEEEGCEFPLNSPWLNSGGGSFFNPDNWAIEQVPSTPFAVLFDDNVVGGGVVSMDVDHTSEALFVITDVVTLELGNLFTLTEASECVSSVEIGALAGPDPAQPSSQLTVLGGQIDAQSVLLGGDAGTTGTMRLDFTQLNSGTDLSIGGDGEGILEVVNGANIHATRMALARNVFADGFAKITGIDSTLEVNERLIVGGLGHAEMEITQSGQLLLQEGSEVIIGQESGSVGSIIVVNEDSAMTGNANVTLGEQFGSSGSLEAFRIFGTGGFISLGAIVVGASGSGELVLTSLGSAEFTQLTAGANERSEGVIRVAGDGPNDQRTGITVDQFTVIAENGTASLTITEGGFVNGGIGSGDQVASSIAAEPGSRGTVTVEGLGSQWHTKVLNIGFGGTAEMFVRDDAEVFSEEAVIGNLDGAIGDVEITSGTWSIDGPLTMGDAGIGRVQLDNNSFLRADTIVVGPLGVLTASNVVIGATAGSAPKFRRQLQAIQDVGVTTNTLSVSDGAVLAVDSVTLGAGGALTGDGNYNFTLSNPGIVSPGIDECTTGSLSVGGDYIQQANGELRIKLGGLRLGVDHDVLLVSGQATLGGTLAITAMNDFRPEPGDQFEILTAENVTGEFETISASGEFVATYEANRIVLTVVASPTVVVASCPTTNVDPEETPNATGALCGAGLLPMFMFTLLGFTVTRRFPSSVRVG